MRFCSTLHNGRKSSKIKWVLPFFLQLWSIKFDLLIAFLGLSLSIYPYNRLYIYIYHPRARQRRFERTSTLEPLAIFCCLPPTQQVVNEREIERESENDPFLNLYFSWNLYILYIIDIPLLLYGGKRSQYLSYGFNILEVLAGCPQKI